MGLLYSTFYYEHPTEDFPNETEIRLKLAAIQTKLNLVKNQKTHSIKNIKDELFKYLQQKNLELCKHQMSKIIKEENLIANIDILISTIIILKEKVFFLYTKEKCPEKVLSQLETLIYSSKKLEIDELTSFIQILSKKFGQQFINDAYDNFSGLVNVNVLARFNTKYNDKYLCLKIREFCQTNNRRFPFNIDLDENVLDDANLQFNREVNLFENLQVDPDGWVVVPDNLNQINGFTSNISNNNNRENNNKKNSKGLNEWVNYNYDEEMRQVIKRKGQNSNANFNGFEEINTNQIYHNNKGDDSRRPKGAIGLMVNENKEVNQKFEDINKKMSLYNPSKLSVTNSNNINNNNDDNNEIRNNEELRNIIIEEEKKIKSKIEEEIKNEKKYENINDINKYNEKFSTFEIIRTDQIEGKNNDFTVIDKNQINNEEKKEDSSDIKVSEFNASIPMSDSHEESEKIIQNGSQKLNKSKNQDIVSKENNEDLKQTVQIKEQPETSSINKECQSQMKESQHDESKKEHCENNNQQDISENQSVNKNQKEEQEQPKKMLTDILQEEPVQETKESTKEDVDKKEQQQMENINSQEETKEKVIETPEEEKKLVLFLDKIKYNNEDSEEEEEFLS